ncbi:3'-5' exonuclease [Phaeovulum vinaykumarii]|uniref:DNA-directed DNA polymerase n=1 Tax=Phaeovulum vinaykumarii TaxID=407234 RepID=A0A1N7KAE2_9RHOB|nr:exonuclease domain-containing protein [Phaeovulum vinaykumarii]SIS58575.1 DNA polymerase-3 subunit epsilon [Phaeovulum vinaykumarii]SOB93845.1 DNA polymerase-3 subunit epsilon [Phaeovulum vinaykumarii]
MIARLSLRLRVFLFFAALAAGNVAALGAGLYFGYHRLGDPSVLNGFIIGGATAGFAIIGLITWVWYLFDENVARPIERLAGGMRARAHADVGSEIDHAPARYLGDLAPAAAAVTENLSQTRNALAEAVARETTRLAGEKDWLETLLADVPVGVLLCTPRHKLVFYNGQAVDLLGHFDAAHAPGLDRRVFDYLHEAPIRHAYSRLIATADPDVATDLLCATTDSGRVLAARMRLLCPSQTPGAGAPGYVLTLRDVTGDLAAHAARERLMDEFFERLRHPAANLQSLIGVVAETGDTLPGGLLPEGMCTAMRTEAAALGTAIKDMSERHDATRADWWPLSLIRAADLSAAVQARLAAVELRVEAETEDLILRCDGFEIVALIAALILRAEEGGRDGFTLRVEADGAGALISIGWRGAPVALADLERWLAAPLEVGMADVTGHRVLSVHATECWPEGGPAPRICLPLREARRDTARPPAVPRAVVYDFELLSKAPTAEVVASRLEDLTYVVFDTETTGLLPSDGDEIVQIAAVRIVNGRRVETEVFDTLVNPGRPIPPGATEVHGITEAMVADAPDIAEVGRRFHKFAEGAVLVAHNAPFDMEFLRRHEAGIGKVFDNPVLDTVLLSAVVFGQSESHSLDALTHRLGITIPEEARHTAIGDTLATADAFLKLLPALKARGLTTFGAVLEEVRKHGRLLKDLNA